MQTRAELIAPCGPEEIFAYVADLDRYPEWMGDLVHSVVSLDLDGAAAWKVELRGRIGPLARSKTLRMVRTEMVPDRLAVFEREEIDGRSHAVWRLRAEVEPVGDEFGCADPGPRSRLVMTLTYEGGLWTAGILDKVLEDQIARGSSNLREMLSRPRR